MGLPGKVAVNGHISPVVRFDVVRVGLACSDATLTIPTSTEDHFCELVGTLNQRNGGARSRLHRTRMPGEAAHAGCVKTSGVSDNVYCVN